jgi:hypothetical protein
MWIECLARVLADYAARDLAITSYCVHKCDELRLLTCVGPLMDESIKLVCADISAQWRSLRQGVSCMGTILVCDATGM